MAASYSALPLNAIALRSCSSLSSVCRRIAAWRRSAKQWPLHGGAAEWLRKWAQSVAERRHAAMRRQTELSEEQLRKAMAFSGSAD